MLPRARFHGYNTMKNEKPKNTTLNAKIKYQNRRKREMETPTHKYMPVDFSDFAQALQ